MASSTLSDINRDALVCIDASILIYHFTGMSAECRALLERVESGEIRALTSTLVVAEVTHRLMMIEAVAGGLVARGNLAKKLRSRPDVVRQLNSYNKHAEQISLMGIGVLPLEVRHCLAAHPLRLRYGLLTNDSLIAASAIDAGAQIIASGDADFARVAELQWCSPSDVGA